MKITLRSKLFLSYSGIILFTLALLSYLVQAQLSQRVQSFFRDFDGDIFPLPERPGDVFLNTIQNSMLFTVLGAASIALVISFIFTDYLTRPIKKMIQATQALARGKYEERVPVESNDELADLCESLNSMAESLEKHRYLQQQLITNVSHELATPLTSIGGYLEALSDDVIDESKREATYALMQEEVQRLNAMLFEVRSLALLEEPHFQLALRPINIQELTQKILEQMAPQCAEKKISINLNCNLEKPVFSIDKNRYTQIVINLLSNAIKYSPEQKPITLSLKANPKKSTGFILEVKDEGQGIPKKDLPYIFERFYRADASRNRKTGGIGIGLSIVKELAEAHGGKVTVESTEGKGSTFRVSF